jgi:hypothetical protein
MKPVPIANQAKHDSGSGTGEVPGPPDSASNPERACPRGGQHDPIKISYGYPTFEMFQAHDRGEIVLGGCQMSLTSPTSRCRKCGLETTEKAGPLLDGLAGIWFNEESRPPAS